MIVSASRRTDIPAFYSPWLLNRIRAGYCTVYNPFNRKQVTRVSLLPEDVTVMVFWTKNPAPLLPFLEEIKGRGLRFYFQYTLNAYPQALEPHLPSWEQNVASFQQLAGLIGPSRVIWRYDPIVISTVTDYAFHLHNFDSLAQRLQGCTQRVVISIVDAYRKAVSNFRLLAQQGITVQTRLCLEPLAKLITAMAEIAAAHGMEIYSCAEAIDLSPYGVHAGKCIDAQYIRQVFGVTVDDSKDKNQRQQCGCVVSKDIGIYDTCLHGCTYCYAGTRQGGSKNRQQHSPDSPSLLGW